MTILVVTLTACSSMPAHRGPDASSRSASTGQSGTSVPTNPSRRSGGGYYLDDGPGDNPPANLELLPDAVPRIEKYASGANRPYNVFGVDYTPDLSGRPYKQRGVGSWYGRKFHGQRTSSGEVYDMYAMTAAHPTLPIPCYALVTNVQTGKSVIVRVNDRGPFLHNRIMDLSYAAALKVGYLSSGSGTIEVEMLMPADIAAGRIPVTTTSLLLASMPAAPAATPQAIVEPPSLTIEALTANERPEPSLPPAPTIVSNASLPIDGAAARAPSVAPPVIEPAVVALADREPAVSLPETATPAGYYLQLGAFRARAGADSFAAHVTRLIDPALASRIKVSDVRGLFRVRVGPYGQRAEADLAAAALRSAVAQPVLVMPEGR